MPYMEIKTSLSLSDEKKHEVCEEIGGLMSMIPGKRREITMINVVDGCYMELGSVERQKQPCLNLELRICGISPYPSKRDFVKEVTAAVGRILDIPPNRTFINIFECDSWGAFGNYVDNNVLDPSLYD